MNRIFLASRRLSLGLLLVLSASAFAQTSTREHIRLQALRAEANQPSVYEITITSPEVLEADAEFVVEFPADFDLTMLLVAGSPDLNGGFTLTREGQRVRAQRSGAGVRVAANTPVHLRLGAIMNPGKLEGEYQVGVQVRPALAATLSAVQKAKVEFQREAAKE
ncbi:MAG: hypothetical protein ACREOO_12425 [bacterium]